MRFVFWIAAAGIAYTYLGYPLWLWIRHRWFPRPTQLAPYTPSISIVLVVRDEAAVLSQKLNNLLELDYPAGLSEIIVVSDGSRDATNDILSDFAKRPGVRIILNPLSRGKAAGLNDAIKMASGEIVVFTDARQKFETAAVRSLMENFADRDVGCASGELMLGDPTSGESTRGMGLYWKIEKTIRELESCTGSVIGATGAIYAVRRNLLLPISPETILDDVLIPMNVIRQGGRVIFDSRARAWDVPDLGGKKEFSRKVRTLSGNYQLLQISPWLLSAANPERFSFVSHKLLRLVVPFALCAILCTSFFLTEPVYRAALIIQVVFYAFSIWGLIGPKHGPLARLCNAASTLVVLNMAAVVAFVNFITRRKVAWAR